MTIAAVFPGQGSQSVGMLGELAQGHPLVGETFEEGGDALGMDLWSLVREGPEAELGRTEHTQPALLAAGVAVWRVWRSQGGCDPVVMAGHSLGEYTALVCADALDYVEAIQLVRARGQLMQSAVPPGVGAMAAILGLDDDQVSALCEQAAQGEVVSAVNFNSPGQVVVAGGRAAVDRLMALARQAGAKRVVPLAVSVPAHSALMQPAVEGLRERLAQVEVRSPRIPVLHNVDVKACEDPEAIRDALARQVHSPVRWVETVRAMAGRGADTLVEMGPGRVLAGLTRRIDRELVGLGVYDPSSLDKALKACEEET